jgi:hypothetical protein
LLVEEAVEDGTVVVPEVVVVPEAIEHPLALLVVEYFQKQLFPLR